MDDYLGAMMLSDDLIQYVLTSRYGERWQPKQRFLLSSTRNYRFTRTIGKAVECVIEHHVKTIYECFNELLDEFSPGTGSFEHLAIESAPHFFPDGYTPEAFIAFCGMICGVAGFYYEAKVKKIAETASGIIGTVLVAFIMTGEFKENGGLERLILTSVNFNTCVLMLENVMNSEVQTRVHEESLT